MKPMSKSDHTPVRSVYDLHLTRVCSGLTARQSTLPAWPRQACTHSTALVSWFHCQRRTVSSWEPLRKVRTGNASPGDRRSQTTLHV